MAAATKAKEAVHVARSVYLVTDHKNGYGLRFLSDGDKVKIQPVNKDTYGNADASDNPETWRVDSDYDPYETTKADLAKVLEAI